MSRDESRVPVTLLTGFLGSGKTTLLNRLLAGEAGRGIAVIVNEFGDIPIDGSLVVGADDDVIELQSGCVCCSVRGDMVETVTRLLERRRRRLLGRMRFDRIVIEASGLASPGPVLQTFRIDERLDAQTELAQVVCLVHAAHAKQQLSEHPEAAEQLAYADLVLLNHLDRVDSEQLAEARAAVTAINAGAELLECERAEVDLERVLASAPRAESSWTLDRASDASGTALTNVAPAVHTHGVSSVSLEAQQPLDLHRLKMWLRLIASQRSSELMRLKGVLHCSDRPEPVVVQGVYQWLEIGPGAGSPPAVSQLVLIGRDLDEAQLRSGWSAIQAASPSDV